MTKLNDNIYIKTLKLGFDNPFGITLKQVIDNSELNNKLDSTKVCNIEFKLTFLLWFYANFHSKSINSVTDIANIKSDVNKTIKKELDEVAVITGDAVNKYIDYLELTEARKSSNTARMFSIISIIIASIAIVVPIVANKYFSPSQKVIITNERNEAESCMFKCPCCTKTTEDKMCNRKSKNAAELNSENYISNKSKIIHFHSDSVLNN